MKMIVLIPMLLVTLTACSAAGVKEVEYTEVVRTMEIDRPFDEVWGYILEWAAINGLPVESTDKNDGILKIVGSGTTTSWMGDADIDQSWVSCGKPTGNIGLYRGTFSDLKITAMVILRNMDDSTRVTVNLTGDVGVQVSNAVSVVSTSRNTCPSRGVFEEKFFRDLKEM